jgi:hypothetical protein
MTTARVVLTCAGRRFGVPTSAEHASVLRICEVLDFRKRM